MMTNGAKAVATTFAVLIGAMSSGFPLLYQLFYVLAGTLALCFVWSRLNLRGIEVKRETLTHRTQVGDTAEERLIIRNTSFYPKVWLEVRDHSTLAGHQASHAFALAGKSTRSYSVTTVCKRRGKYWLGPLTVVAGDPFGLFQTTEVIAERHPLIVYPATVELSELEIPVGELPGGANVARRSHFVTPNVSSIRQYAPGDSFNRIHWLSTARMRQLMTKEFELDPASDVWVFLDMESRVQAGEGVDSTEEYGVTIGASIARHYLSQNRAVGLVAYGARHEVIHGDRGTRQVMKILESLAVVRAEGRVPLAEIIVAEGSRFGRNTTLVVVTPSVDEDWVQALRHLKLRGVRTAAIVLEASTFGSRDSSVLLFSSLASADIPTFLVKKGDALDRVLSGPGTNGH